MFSAYCQSSQGSAYKEMRQKTIRDAFFSLRSGVQVHRPASVATEFVDTDWDEEILSEIDDNSPRFSLQSAGQPSFTTVSSYDEVSTPRSSSERDTYPENALKQVQGPYGPHLFRSSTDPSLDDDDEFVLTLSPITPKSHRGIGDLLDRPLVPRKSSPFAYTDTELDSSTLASWTPEMVAQSMLNAGIELFVADRFVENDINGALLINLKFGDLRELDIQSFGIRTKVWHQIQALRDCQSSPPPRPATPIEDVPSPEAREETRKAGGHDLGRRQNSKRRPRRKASAEEDSIHPMESVSIIGIEQVIPKPHQCSKGENCPKWKKQQKIIEQFKKLNPTVDFKNGGTVMIYGDAGNPETARAIDPNEVMRPMSDAVPSVVASSDVLGPGGLPPLQYLQETTLINVQAQDPQDYVRQFLSFQQRPANSDQVPPTPPFELIPSSKPAHQGLRRLPKLSIPVHSQQPGPIPLRIATVPQSSEGPPEQQGQRAGMPQVPRQSTGFFPYRMDKAVPLSPDLGTCRNPYRFGTPFSEMDVPVMAVPVGPVARDASQSVPPDMNYRAAAGPYPTAQPRSQSRASARRPSFPVLPAVSEDMAVRQLSKSPSSQSTSPVHHAQTQPQPQQPLQAPPRFYYPWSPAERTKLKQAIPQPLSNFGPRHSSDTPVPANGVTYQGPMKKRKTRLLRNEWQNGYFTLKGTRLNMHKDAQEIDRTLEYIDIDDYAIACSSLASRSKLSAAFKAVHISHDRKKSDPIGAFSFQLIPQDRIAGARMRKRDSSVSGMSGSGPSEGVNGTGKTHHFAVTNRDERIEWMRELMLAKAMKQKGEGYEISVNGNMI